MKKITALSLATASLLYAQTIDISSGWQLLGTNEDINISQSFNDTDLISVWGYENKSGWAAYSPQSSVSSQIQANLTISNLEELSANSGFWVNAQNITSINLPSSNNNSDFNINPGWQLLGTAHGITDMQQFNKESIQTVWSYDTGAKRWAVYSPIAEIMSAVNQITSIDTLSSLGANSGFWVYGTATDIVTISDTNTNINNIKTQIEELNTLNNTATVADAKNMFNQLREAYTTLADFDAINFEDNTSTIIGAQANTITTNIEPVLDTISTDLNNTLTSLESSVEQFSTDLNSSFTTVFDKIGLRLEAIDTARDLVLATVTTSWSEEDYSVTSSQGDTFAHTYTASTDTATETYTLNDTTLTTTYKTTEDGLLMSVSTTGAITLADTDYNLSIDSISFENNSTSITASGIVTGLNGSTITLDNSSLNFDVDFLQEESSHILQNLEAVIDGSVSVNGRTLHGNLNASEINSTISISGSYTGTSTEPSFEGKVQLKSSFSDIKDLSDAADIYNFIDPNSLLEITFDDGTKSFVKSYTGAMPSYTLTAQNGKQIVCSTADADNSMLMDWTTSVYQKAHTVACVGGSVQAYYGEGKKVTANVNGTQMNIQGAWVDYATFFPSIIFEDYENSPTYLDIDGDLALNGQKIIIKDIKIEEFKSIADIDAEVLVEANITHGTNTLALKAGIDKSYLSDIYNIYAKDLKLQTAKGSISVSNIAATGYTNSKTIYTNMTMPDSNYGYSLFEDYSVEIDNYGYQDYKVYDDSGLSFDLDNLLVSITDGSSNTLTVDANITASNNSEDKATVKFRGFYNYAGTSFKGIIDTIVDEPNETVSYFVSGDVQANGFEPFGIESVGDVDNNTTDAYGIFTRSDSYKLAISASKQYGDINTTVDIIDSNGVTMNFADESSSIVIENTSGTKLGEMGEDLTGNNWEIQYTDNTSETLF